MLKILKSLAAQSDLLEIFDYSAHNWGEKKAEIYIRRIEKAILRIAKNPHIGTIRNDVPSPYLSFSINSHLIIYRHNTIKLEIMNILHPAMDIKSRIIKSLEKPTL